MVRYLADLIFMTLAWIILIYLLYTGAMSIGDFIIGATLTYVGARFLFVTDFICEILEERVVTTIEKVDE